MIRRPTIAVLAALVAAGCVAGPDRPGAARSTDAPTRPRLRQSGPRLPPTSGSSPAARGWHRVGDLLWVKPEDEGSWAAFLAGSGPPPAAPPLVLRTDHVSLRTDVNAVESVRIARLAEAHVRGVVQAWGDALDLRVPTEPLSVVVHASRASFQSALRDAAPGHPGWGAFYDAVRGTVHVSVEPAPVAALPLQADLRHEMTHQILDLSTPTTGRSRIFQGHYLWLWEGFAAYTETLGDRPGEDSMRLRRERFSVRRWRGEVTPLPTLFQLDQRSFEGRHYDQSALLLAYLLREDCAAGRRAVLDTLARLLRGTAREDDFERALGMSAAALDAAWRQSG